MGSPATKLAANPELAEVDRDSTRDVEWSVERRSAIDPTPVATSPVPPRGAVSTLGSHRGAPKGVEATQHLKTTTSSEVWWCSGQTVRVAVESSQVELLVASRFQGTTTPRVAWWRNG